MPYPRKLASGKQVWDIVANAAGKQKWLRGFEGTVTQAASKRDEMKADLRAGRLGKPAARMTVGEFIEMKWLPTKQSKLKSENSRIAYAYRISKIRATSLGSMRLSRVEAYDVEEFIQELRESLGQATTNQVYDVLKAAFTKAVLWKDLAGNPCAGVETPPEGDRREVRLTIDEIIRLLEVADQTPHGAMIYFTVMTGLRWSEVASLRWSEIDFGESKLDIPVAKSEAGERGVYLGPDTIARLQAHRIAVMGRIRSLHPDAAVPDFVFPSSKLTQWVDATFRREWRKIRKAAGLDNMDVRSHGVKDLHFHDLRHLHSTLGAKVGAHPTLMQHRLGHANPETTLSVYTHVTNTAEQASAAIAIEELVSTARTKKRE